MKNDSDPTTTEQRKRMIAEAAYFRAEKKGFASSDPVQDWLTAEEEIDKHLEELRVNESQKQVLEAYEKMRRKMKKMFADTRDTINADTLKQAFDKVNKEFKNIGEFLPETVDKAGKKFKNEMAAAVQKLDSNRKDFSDKSLELFDVWKDRGTHFLNQATDVLNDWLSQYRSKNKNKDK
jgi:hypothetical protein